ncbi:hypothetical protein DPMN_153462 [Dreissena polymorpha]|uniref:Uncharacterized protein n=1 Tax=Dreissena polymorpha TaxID=45954 RepID=A0A9D4FNX6_DREPO|nr:hypothetical protein DPMN_153462 [Dreissena polymorpha]
MEIIDFTLGHLQCASTLGLLLRALFCAVTTLVLQAFACVVERTPTSIDHYTSTYCVLTPGPNAIYRILHLMFCACLSSPIRTEFVDSDSDVDVTYSGSWRIGNNWFR